MTINLGRAIFLAGVTVVGSAQASDVFRGKDLYQRHCVGCHGEKGEGMMPGMPNFTRGDRVFSKMDTDLAATVRQGSGIMPGFAAILNDTDIQDVVAYLRTLL